MVIDGKEQYLRNEFFALTLAAAGVPLAEWVLKNYPQWAKKRRG